MNNNGNDNSNNTVVVDDNVVVDVAAAAPTNATVNNNNDSNSSSQEEEDMNEDEETAAAANNITNLAAAAAVFAEEDRHWKRFAATANGFTSVQLNLKTRLTCNEQSIPDSLFAPIIYQLCVKVQHAPVSSAQELPAFVMARLSVHFDDQSRSLAKNRDGKPIINGNGEFALTSTGTTVGTFQGQLKIKFNDVSYNNNKARFLFKLDLFHPSDLNKTAIWSAESASFKVYARKKQDKKRKTSPSANSSPQSASPNSVDSPQEQQFSQASPSAAYVPPVQQVVHPHPPLIANLHVKKSAFQDRQGVNNAKCDGLVFAARPPSLVHVTAVDNSQLQLQQSQQQSNLVVAAANNNNNNSNTNYFAPSAVASSATIAAATAASSAANHAAVAAAAAAAAAHGKAHNLHHGQIPTMVYPPLRSQQVAAVGASSAQLGNYHRNAKKQKLIPANSSPVLLPRKPHSLLVSAPQQPAAAAAAVTAANSNAAHNAAQAAATVVAPAHAANAGNTSNTNVIMNFAPQKHQEECSSDQVIVAQQQQQQQHSNNKQLDNDTAIFAEFANKFRELQFDVTRKLDQANRAKAIEFALNEFFKLDPLSTSRVMFQSLQKMVQVGLANSNTTTGNNDNTPATTKQVPVVHMA